MTWYSKDEKEHEKAWRERIELKFGILMQIQTDSDSLRVQPGSAQEDTLQRLMITIRKFAANLYMSFGFGSQWTYSQQKVQPAKKLVLLLILFKMLF